MRPAWLVVVLLTVCAGGGADGGPAPASSPPTATVDRLSATNRAALDALVATSPQSLDVTHLDHDIAGHDVWGPVPEPVLDAAAAALEEQWSGAVAAAEELATPADAEAAGYQRAAAELPGIGAHFVRWDLVDAPFDPARPSMLLYDESTARPDRLAGFSYWTRSVGAAPDGFAGGGDHWHMHHGLCFQDGMLTREAVLDPADCDGDWLAGTDLWMGHAWVNPDLPNPWGRFAPRNPAVCPGPSEGSADFARCPDPLPAPPAEPLLDANALWCSLPDPAGEAAGAH